jgi:hypothetical protein
MGRSQNRSEALRREEVRDGFGNAVWGRPAEIHQRLGSRAAPRQSRAPFSAAGRSRKFHQPRVEDGFKIPLSCLGANLLLRIDVLGIEHDPANRRFAF